MTQKELLYAEDAVGHEKALSSILKSSITSIKDEDLKTFLQKEKEKHDAMEQKLMKTLKEASK